MTPIRVKAVVTKELRHILRDWQTLMIVLCMPVVMMFLYGYALNMELSEVPVAMIDPSLSKESSRIAESLEASPFFSVPVRSPETKNLKQLFRTHHVKAVIRFPAGFTGSLRATTGASLQVLIDGSDPNTAIILASTLEGVIRSVLASMFPSRVVPGGIRVTHSVLYNREQKSSHFFVPGLMAIILLMISAMLTSLALTREKETGTIEQLLVSPLHPAEIVIGKIIPYSLLSIGSGVIIILVSRIVFSVHCSGSLLLLSLCSILYIFTALAMGLVISTIASNQQQAMMIVLPVTMLPTIILSGFIFPLTSLPAVLRGISCFVPATWYLIIIRGIMLKGVGVVALHQAIIILSVMTLLFISIAIHRFRGHP